MAKATPREISNHKFQIPKGKYQNKKIPGFKFQDSWNLGFEFLEFAAVYGEQVASGLAKAIPREISNHKFQIPKGNLKSQIPNPKGKYQNKKIPGFKFQDSWNLGFEFLEFAAVYGEQVASGLAKATPREISNHKFQIPRENIKMRKSQVSNSRTLGIWDLNFWNLPCLAHDF